MKCPHCGIEVRDTTVECGYCGGKIPQRSGKPSPAAGTRQGPVAGTVQKPAAAKKPNLNEPEPDEEGEDGLSAYLQPGEQVLIGSLNISVKKFFFHAYLTDRRIFLIDTQEKKLKVTAKDIPLESIAGSIVEFSENSDPVLVLSIRSADEEIKTMKLIFAQDGMDRSSEIDEWIDLLQEQTRPKKQKKPPLPQVPEPVPGTNDEPARAPVPKPAALRQDLYPAKKPVKDHEKQPPVKRLLSLYQVSKQKEPEPQEPEVRGADVRAPEKTVRKIPGQPVAYREIPPIRQPVVQPVKKDEMQSAMKGAIAGAMRPTRQPAAQPEKRPVAEPVKKVRMIPEIPVLPEHEKEPAEKEHEPQEEGGAPLFCHNCGKKLPAAAHFCPGCGTKLGHHKPSQSGAAVHEKKSGKPDQVHDEEKGERRPSKPPVRKAPKGSEMTILHKFLRR
jgi:hypothetical protein